MIATSVDTFSAKFTDGNHVFRQMIRGEHVCSSPFCSTIQLVGLPQHCTNLSSGYSNGLSSVIPLHSLHGTVPHYLS
jgi:hypothetical protein